MSLLIAHRKQSVFEQDVAMSVSNLIVPQVGECYRLIRPAGSKPVTVARVTRISACVVFCVLVGPDESECDHVISLDGLVKFFGNGAHRV